LIDVYNKEVDKNQENSKEEIKNFVDYSIKWTRADTFSLTNVTVH